MYPADLPDFVNRADVRMGQCGCGSCFLLKATEAIWFSSERCGQDFQGDITTEFLVFRSVDLAHAARAEDGHNLVRSEARARSEDHDSRALRLYRSKQFRSDDQAKCVDR